MPPKPKVARSSSSKVSKISTKKPSSVKSAKSTKLPPFVTGSAKRAADMSIFKDMAIWFAAGNSIDAIKSALNSSMPKYRSMLTGGNPDGECNTASREAMELGRIDSPVYGYQNTTSRSSTQSNALRSGISGGITVVDERPFSWAKNEDKRMTKYPFTTPIGRGDCGNCWMCGVPVYFYYNKDFVTGCGECEHVGGIVGSFLAGMLTSSMRAEKMFNYGTAHAHCNQKKSDTLSMKYDAKADKWTVDENGIQKIVDAMFGDIHGSEYDPLFVTAHSRWTSGKRNEIATRIKTYTNSIWCPHANAILAQQSKSKKDVAARALTIMMWTVNNRKSAFRGGSVEAESYSSMDNGSIDRIRSDTGIKKKLEFEGEAETNEEEDEVVDMEEEEEDQAVDMTNEEENEVADFDNVEFYYPDDIFGITITSDEQAQRELDALRADPEFSVLLSNFIRAIDESLTKTEGGAKKRRVTKRKAMKRAKKTAKRRQSKKRSGKA